MFSLYLADKQDDKQEAAALETEREPDLRSLPFVKDALASIEQGGYAEALARVAYLLRARENRCRCRSSR